MVSPFQETPKQICCISGVRRSVFAAAREVLVSGCSAGGLSAFLHCQSWSDLIKRSNPSTKVRCVPVSGFFLDFNGLNPWGARMRSALELHNATAGLNHECTRSETNTSSCVFAEVAAAYVRIPIFVIQPKYDEWAIPHILQSSDPDLVSYFGNQLVHRLGQSLNLSDSNGLFVDGCYRHCDLPGDWMRDMINVLVLQWLGFQSGNDTVASNWSYLTPMNSPCSSCCGSADRCCESSTYDVSDVAVLVLAVLILAACACAGVENWLVF